MSCPAPSVPGTSLSGRPARRQINMIRHGRPRRPDGDAGSASRPSSSSQPVSAAADCSYCRRRLPGRSTATSRSRMSWRSTSAHDSQRLLDLDPRRAASAILGAVIGLAIASPITFGGLPRAVRSHGDDLFRRRLELCRHPAGLRLPRDAWPGRPRHGLAAQEFGINLRAGLQPPVFWGLTITYLFFQIPLMILIITPALEGLKKRVARGLPGRWARPACSTGAMVALPMLWPSLLGTLALLFANAFGAVATAYRADRLLAQHRADPALRADPRRRARQSGPRLRAGARHDRDHRLRQRSTSCCAPAPKGG
jgi:hypothetical protein